MEEEQVLERKGCLSYSANWIDYGNSFCCACLPSGVVQQGTTRGHRSGCVSLLVAVTRDLIALLEEQMVDMLLFY